MNGYENHRTTLDPGLTALALRARARADETYVFVRRPADSPWWRRAWIAANRLLPLRWNDRRQVEKAA
jgi:hypothetical protein